MLKSMPVDVYGAEVTNRRPWRKASLLGFGLAAVAIVVLFVGTVRSGYSGVSPNSSVRSDAATLKVSYIWGFANRSARVIK